MFLTGRLSSSNDPSLSNMQLEGSEGETFFLPTLISAVLIHFQGSWAQTMLNFRPCGSRIQEFPISTFCLIRCTNQVSFCFV